MAGQRGRDILLKVADAQQPGQFVTIAGIRTQSFELNSQSVDATVADSPGGWREVLTGAGVKSARVRGSGVFKDAASDERMRALFFSDQQAEWQLIIPGLGSLSGPFHIRTLQWTGAYDAEATFAIDLESAGALSFGSA